MTNIDLCLVRGKRKDNEEWVEGYYFYYHTNPCILSHGEKFSDFEHHVISVPHYGDWNMWSFDDYEIIPETLGRFTGLLDKNGNKIWEGDILQNENGNRIVCKFEIQDSHSAFYFKDQKAPTKMFCNIPIFFEIIGNVHDNPELLKGE